MLIGGKGGGGGQMSGLHNGDCEGSEGMAGWVRLR